MNKLYAKRHGMSVENTKNTTAENAVKKLIEREKESKERSQHIIDYYRNGGQKGTEI